MLRPQSSSASRDGYGKVNYEHPAQSGLKRNYFGICELQKKMCAVSMRERPPCTQSSKASSARSLITSTRTDYACRTTHNPVSILPTLAPLLHIDDGAVLVESEDFYLAPQDIKRLNHILLHACEASIVSRIACTIGCFQLSRICSGRCFNCMETPGGGRCGACGCLRRWARPIGS